MSDNENGIQVVLEFWFNFSVINVEVEVDGYKLIRFDWLRYNVGGVCFYVRRFLKFIDCLC